LYIYISPTAVERDPILVVTFINYWGVFHIDFVLILTNWNSHRNYSNALEATEILKSTKLIIAFRVSKIYRNNDWNLLLHLFIETAR
jgi:hypothetical protein